MRELTLSQLQERLTANPRLTLLEALPAKHFADSHLPGALHFPHDQVQTLAATVIPDKNTEIVTYCASASCQNSHIAARLLVQMGYQNVSVFAGGKQAWHDAGLPMESMAVNA